LKGLLVLWDTLRVSVTFIHRERGREPFIRLAPGGETKKLT